MVTDRISSDVDAVKADMSQLRADVAHLAQTMLDASKTGVKEARIKLEEEAQKRLDQIREAAAAARDRGKIAVEGVQEKIEAHPLTSVAVAFGFGLLIGRLLDRR